MPEAGFQMDEFMQICGPQAAMKYPKNRLGIIYGFTHSQLWGSRRSSLTEQHIVY